MISTNVKDSKIFTGGLQNILNNEQMKAGFRLAEDEDFLYLFDEQNKLHCVFYAYGTTAESIRNEVTTLMYSQAS